jgi:DNA-binding NtrC family response regulator
MLGSGLGIFRGRDEALPPLAASEESQSGSRRSGAGQPRILVVDDERLLADSLADILNGSGFRATVAYDGREALQIASRIRPDYLLTDVVMPTMNGVELAIAVAEELPATTILLFSGQAGIADILHDGRQRGYDFDLIAKPIHPDRLIDCIRQAKKKQA